MARGTNPGSAVHRPPSSAPAAPAPPPPPRPPRWTRAGPAARRPPRPPAAPVAQPQVAELGRRRPEPGRSLAAAAELDLIERADRLMPGRQPLDGPAGRRDAPQLHRAVDRGEERQPAAVGGRDEAGRLAGDD